MQKKATKNSRKQSFDFFFVFLEGGFTFFDLHFSIYKCKLSFASLSHQRPQIQMTFLRFSNSKKRGNVTMILGSMFAEKTSELLQALKIHRYTDLKACLIKHAADTRYSHENVVTHDDAAAGKPNETGTTLVIPHEGVTRVIRRDVRGVRADFIVSRLRDVDDAKLMTYDVICVDEAQFFPDLLWFCKRMASVFGKQIFVAGLKSDRHGVAFAPIQDLFPECENIIVKYAVCMVCRDACASFTVDKWEPTPDARKGKRESKQDSKQESTDASILLGAAERYMAVCRECRDAFMLANTRGENQSGIHVVSGVVSGNERIPSRL